MSTAITIVGALVALFLCPFALWSMLWYVGNRISTSGLYDVQNMLMALPDVPLHVKQAAWVNLWQAIAADERTKVYDWSAPLVCAIALIGLPQTASRLPAWARKWDNNVSLNGDGYGWQDPETGEWFDIRVKPAPAGVHLVSHSDPDYGGDCYYAPGHHPRSFWARYVWVGLRNRASALSVRLGRDVTARPVVVSGDPTIHRHGPYGHFVLRHGDTFHYKSIRAFGPFALTRSYGYKLEIPFKSAEGTGRAAAVAIGRSLKRRGA